MPGLFNEILAGRFNRGVQKLFNIKGGPPSPQLGSEIIPIFPLFSGNENRNLEGWQRFGAVFFNAASVGNVGVGRLRIPRAQPGVSGGSLVVAVIEAITVTFIGNDSYNLAVQLQNSSDLGGGTAVVAARTGGLDNRGQIASVASLTQVNAAPGIVTSNWDEVSGLAGTSLALIRTVNDEITILPDMQLTIASSTANQINKFAIRWRERVMEESEAIWPRLGA